MTITALLDVQIKPEQSTAAASVIRDTLQATRAFPGCLGVEVVVDLADPAHFVLIEKWESLEADEAYRAWRATPEGRSDLGSILAGPPSLTKFATDETI
jgi:quinol monooxygenase YgiN